MEKSIKKFTISAEYNDETGDVSINTTASGGITPLEIIGILELKRLDMFNQLTNYTLFKRKRIHEDGSVEEISEVEDA